MPTNNPKYRRPLNSQQLQLLQAFYKFRFITIPLIAQSQSISSRVMQSRLQVLLDQEYIGRNYNKSYRIQGKSASYYLLAKGIAVHRDQPYANPRTLRSLVSDKRAINPVIAHHLDVLGVYVAIKRLYPDVFRYFSKNELVGRHNYPEILPDAFMTRIATSETQANAYFVDYLEVSTPYWQQRKKIRQYISYAEDDEWRELGLVEPPSMLIICETKILAGKMLRLAKAEMEASYAELSILVTTKDELLNASPGDLVWKVAGEAQNVSLIL